LVTVIAHDLKLVVLMLNNDNVAAPLVLLLPEAAMFIGDQLPVTNTLARSAPSNARITVTVATQLRRLLPVIVEITVIFLIAMRGKDGTGTAGLGEGLWC
jgi:hypothetical protein